MIPTIFAERNHAGAWVLSHTHPSGYQVTRQYYGYSLREATRMFRKETKKGAK